jgi:hypothetical protein
MVNDLSEENQKLKDTIAIGAWDATDIEKEDIQDLWPSCVSALLFWSERTTACGPAVTCT